MIIVIHLQGGLQLPDVSLPPGITRFNPCVHERHQHNAGQERDDGNDHEQFDEGKASLFVFDLHCAETVNDSSAGAVPPHGLVRAAAGLVMGSLEVLAALAQREVGVDILERFEHSYTRKRYHDLPCEVCSKLILSGLLGRNLATWTLRALIHLAAA